MLIVENVYVVVNMYATHSYPVEQKQGVGRSGWDRDTIHPVTWHCTFVPLKWFESCYSEAKVT